MAKGAVAADILTETDQQGVVFIKQPNISWQTIHKERLVGSIAIVIRSQTNAVDDTPGISVNNKNWLVGSIQYYGVSRLLPNAMDGKKLLAELLSIIGKQFTKAVVIMFAKPVSEGFEL